MKRYYRSLATAAGKKKNVGVCSTDLRTTNQCEGEHLFSLLKMVTFKFHFIITSGCGKNGFNEEKSAANDPKFYSDCNFCENKIDKEKNADIYNRGIIDRLAENGCNNVANCPTSVRRSYLMPARKKLNI